jgi:uncharacterized protein
MRQRWARLTFLHWSFDPAAVQRLLPDGLVADTFAGAAWVGLVPFYMNVGTAGRQISPNVGTAGRQISPNVGTAGRQISPNAGTGNGHQLPWVSRFCETNVRTYVRDRAGRAGIWFFSLDAARLGAVAVARTTYRLPYFWSAMDISDSDDEITYRCRRRLPDPSGVTSVVRVSIGDRYLPGELDLRDHFLTARWILFSVSGRGGARHRLARACHDPWPLYRAQPQVVEDRLVVAAGLPEPQDEPLVHYSPGVDVTIGRPEQAR